MDLTAERAALEFEELAIKRRRLQIETAKLEEEEAAAVARRKASKTIVRLNVSGTHFDTHRDTLLAAGSRSYFALMLSEDHPHALDTEGRLFIDRDPRLFGLLLQFLRGSLQRAGLSATTCTELLAEADFFQCERLVYWIYDEYDPSCLDPADQRLLDEAEAKIRGLERKDADAMHSVDSDFLVDVVASPEQFVCTRQLAPGTARMPILFAALQEQFGRAAGATLPIQAPAADQLTPPGSTAEQRVTALLGASRAAMRWATEDDTRWTSLGWDERLRRAAQAHALDAFRARFALFAGPLLDGLDLTHLVVAGGSVLHALMLGEPTDPEVQAAARKGPADVDIFVVAPDDASARAAFERLFTHLRERLGAAPRWEPDVLQAAPDEDGNAGAGPTDDNPRPDGLIVRPWPDREDVQGALLGQLQPGEDPAGIETREAELYERLRREDGVPPFGLAARELLVLRSSHAVTFAAGWPQRHIQVILRRYACISEVLLYFDVDACQLAYDGRTVVATPAARRALVTGVNVADASKRSASYEQRLHKYARRGFGVVVPGLDTSRVAERLTSGLFTRSEGGLRPVRVTLPEEENAQPTYEVGEALLGLPKLVVLSALTQTEAAILASQDGGRPDASDEEEEVDPRKVLTLPNVGFSTTPGFARSGAATAALRASDAADDPDPVAPAGALSGARLVDLEYLKGLSSRRQRLVLSRLGQLGRTTVTPSVVPRVREEDYDGIILPYSARFCRTPSLMRKRLRRRLKDKDNPLPPVVWDHVILPHGWSEAPPPPPDDPNRRFADLRTVLDAAATSEDFWALLKNDLPQKLEFKQVEGVPFQRLPWHGWFGDLYDAPRHNES